MVQISKIGVSSEDSSVPITRSSDHSIIRSFPWGLVFRLPIQACYLRDKCYTSRFRHMSQTALNRCLSVLLFFTLTAGAAPQQSSPSPASTFAQSFVHEILSKAGSPSSATVSFQNVSLLPPDSQETAQNAIFTSFRDAGVHLVKPEQAMVDVQVIFSEDCQGYIWIAVIQQGPSRQIVMRRLPRTERPAATHLPTLAIHKFSVWQQDAPILDFFTDNQNLVVLDPGQISWFTNDSGQWRPRDTLAIVRAQPWPRDLRGRLQVNGQQITAFLPGTRCTGTLSPPSLDCRVRDDPWPVDQGTVVAFFSSRRNFFTGVLAGPSGGASVIPFFSGAAWPNGDQRMWLFAGTDGRARLYQNDLSAPTAQFNAWGSNLAALHSGCGSGWQMLVSGPGDTTRPDSVQAVEIAGREALPVSVPVDLAGSISAMWTSGKGSETVNGVMQSPATGKYEAFILTVSCN